MLAEELPLTIAAALTGAAIYVNIVEQPARLQLDNRSLLAEWKPAYKRGYVMQASLAIVGGLFGLLAYLNALDWRWLLGRSDSPWYPTAKIYRQDTPGDWDGVLQRVKTDLIGLQSETH